MESHLLKLPGEIRNRIYEFVSHERIVELKRTRDGSNVNKVVPYASLTRVCRKIRQEYLPIQQREARVSIHSSQLNEFLGAFFNEDNPMRVLVIRFGPGVTKSHPKIDFLPILRARARFPGRLRCRSSSLDWALPHRSEIEPDTCVQNLRLLLTYQEDAWLSMLCEKPCPLLDATFSTDPDAGFSLKFRRGGAQWWGLPRGMHHSEFHWSTFAISRAQQEIVEVMMTTHRRQANRYRSYW